VESLKIEAQRLAHQVRILLVKLKFYRSKHEEFTNLLWANNSMLILEAKIKGHSCM